MSLSYFCSWRCSYSRRASDWSIAPHPTYSPLQRAIGNRTGYRHSNPDLEMPFPAVAIGG
jgi:hypothetical protein